MDLNLRLDQILGSFLSFIPELILVFFILILITTALFRLHHRVVAAVAIAGLILTMLFILRAGFGNNTEIFTGMLRPDGLSAYLKVLFIVAGLFTCIMSFDRQRERAAEYYAVLVTAIFGCHLLVMTSNFVMIFIALETISISSYVLAGFSFSKAGSEGSLKYFFFGAAGSSIMLYGFSWLYGITGSVDFLTPSFFEQLLTGQSILSWVACIMVLAGFLYKMAAVPMHLWAPDVYEAAPLPVVAFFSVAPKLAGLGVLLKFVVSANLFGQGIFDWQVIVCGIAILTITVGNVAALRQSSAKRMMAYSSIAQSGFLLVGVTAFHPLGIHFMLFYAGIYTLMNFVVFLGLSHFEGAGITSIAAFAGTGKNHLWPSIFMLIGLVSLTGLPPTAGFTAKLFIFSGLWQSYQGSGKDILMWLFIAGLLNTVISLFYYLRIPYFAFLKSSEPAEKQNIITFQNLLAFILVLGLLVLFFMPGLLMGWINKINFVL
jgi:NADH-quinone oxidoreductase subunit N